MQAEIFRNLFACLLLVGGNHRHFYPPVLSQAIGGINKQTKALCHGVHLSNVKGLPQATGSAPPTSRLRF